MAKLQPCTACQRHIRPDETRCPFCGARAGIAKAPLVVAAVVGVAIAANACKEDEALPAYGIPPIETDAGVSDGGS